MLASVLLENNILIFNCFFLLHISSPSVITLSRICISIIFQISEKIKAQFVRFFSQFETSQPKGLNNDVSNRTGLL